MNALANILPLFMPAVRRRLRAARLRMEGFSKSRQSEGTKGELIVLDHLRDQIMSGHLVEIRALLETFAARRAAELADQDALTINSLRCDLQEKTDFLFICLFRLKYTVERPA